MIEVEQSVNKRPWKGCSIREILTDYTVIDLETTGKYVDRCEVIEMAAVRVRNGTVVDTFSTFVKPENKIPVSISLITGITNEMIAGAPDCHSALDDFITFVGKDIILGHNVTSFDVNIIYDCCLKYYATPFRNNFLDTLHFAKCCELNLDSYKLTELTAYFKIEHNAHRALNDCLATHELYEKLKQHFKGTYKKKENINSRPRFNTEYTEQTKALQELSMIVKRIVNDGKLTDDEVYGLEKWLKANDNLAGNYPFDVLFSAINEVLEDGIITEEERCHLEKLLYEYADPVSSHETKEVTDIAGKQVCLTGEFDTCSRSEFSEMLETYGADVKKNVSKKTDYLIVGGKGSAQWSCGNYGGKIKKAVELQENGANIKIVREDEILKCLTSKC